MSVIVLLIPMQTKKIFAWRTWIKKKNIIINSSIQMYTPGERFGAYTPSPHSRIVHVNARRILERLRLRSKVTRGSTDYLSSDFTQWFSKWKVIVKVFLKAIFGI